MKSTAHSFQIISLGVLLTLLATLYCGYALFVLAIDNGKSFPIDLRLRWFEQHLLYQGINPQEGGHSDPLTDKTHPVIRQEGSEYPAWSYATIIPLIPPVSWPIARLYFAGIAVILLGFIAVCSYNQTKPYGGAAGYLAAVAVLAIFPFAICVSYGQLTIFVTACLIGTLLSYEQGHKAIAGVFLGAALVKPHIASLFVLAFLVRLDFKVLFFMMIYIITASGITWVLSNTDPLHMLLAGSKYAHRNITVITHNRLLVVLANVMGQGPAVLALAISVGGMCVFVLARYGKYLSMWSIFSFCAIASMFLSYRKHYDVVILSIPMVYLLNCYFRTRSNIAIAVWFIFGLSLWAPIHDVQWTYMSVFLTHAVVWSFASIMLLHSEIQLRAREKSIIY